MTTSNGTPERQDASLIDALPAGASGIAELPDGLRRRTLGAFRLQIHHDERTNRVRYRVTLADDPIAGVARVAKRRYGRDASNERSCPSVWCPRQDSNLRPSA